MATKNQIASTIWIMKRIPIIRAKSHKQICLENFWQERVGVKMQICKKTLKASAFKVFLYAQRLDGTGQNTRKYFYRSMYFFRSWRLLMFSFCRAVEMCRLTVLGEMFIWALISWFVQPLAASIAAANSPLWSGCRLRRDPCPGYESYASRQKTGK